MKLFVLRFSGLARAWVSSSLPSMSAAEQWRSSFGALLGIGLCGFLLHAMPLHSNWLIAPIGASVVILFVQPHSPVAQPWSVISSYFFATLVGLVCTHLIPNAVFAAAVGVAVTVWLMIKFNGIHPPGGALVLLMVLDGPGGLTQTSQTVSLVALNVLLMLLFAWLINTWLLGRPYPYRVSLEKVQNHNTRDLAPMQRSGLDHTDLASAVTALNTFVDIQEDELVSLYNLAVEHAFERHIGLACGDVMSRDVITVKTDTHIELAWNRLRHHRVKALPVLDHADRLVGILSVADFLRQMDDTSAAGLAMHLQGMLQRMPGAKPKRAIYVHQIMSTVVSSARLDTPITEVMGLMIEKNLPHIPVIDEDRKVLGIVTQTDTLAALYKRVALASA
ncbi:HPP family protein [Rhodoferax sp.]|uniref:HPP family protein n=1 Tax=Rhodoferax sp. TaxID=50421 RepID=UPI00260644F0|nr:HPP family protein [Rhodoferax sp.]MDD2919133.1 HPP family protein [Rhodoferax sp.]